MKIALLWVALLMSLSMNVYWLVTLNNVHEAAPEPVNTHQSGPGHHQPTASVDTVAQRGYGKTFAEDASSPALATLLEQGHYGELETRLRQALRDSPDDVALLLLEAELMVRTRPLSDAVLHLYSLRDLPLSAPQRQQLEQRIDELVSTAVSQLRAAGHWDLLAQLVEPLFQVMPAHRPHILQLAEAYARQNKPTLMEDVLASMLPDDPQANRIRSLLPATSSDADENEAATAAAMPDTDVDRAITLQLEADGPHFIASVRFANQPARLMLDTGATTTAITRQFYNRLTKRQQLPFIGNFEVETAAGRISASMVQVPVVSFGPLRFTNLAVLVLPEDVMRDADGLLGMNMMQNMDFRLNQQTGELTLFQHRR